jgi:hypothetical protein
MFKCLIALTAFLPAATLAATIWTWVDERGQRHYSDREVPGATRVEVAGAQSFSGSALQPAQTSGQTPGQAQGQTQAAGAQESESVIYTTFRILSPEPGETLRNIEGQLPVEVATVPALAVDHRIDVVLDGQRRQLGARALELTVPEVWRGEHSLQALIVNAEGEILRETPAITIYVHQTSVLN